MAFSLYFFLTFPRQDVKRVVFGGDFTKHEFEVENAPSAFNSLPLGGADSLGHEVAEQTQHFLNGSADHLRRDVA